jgi:2-deoxy-D-gluconate 3-dehydrogenase
MFNLEGKAAIVTGGNGGIGLGMAKGIASRGADVLVVGRNAEKNAGAVAELRALGVRAEGCVADVTKEADCTAMAAAAAGHFGRIDILVNNAGTNIRKQPEDYTLEEWRTVIDTNLTSTFLCCQAVYPYLRKQGGKIINNGSMMSIFGAAFAGPYGASKGGVMQLTRSLATAWAKDNIQVNVVLPGWIDTDLTRRARTDVTGLHEKVEARTPAGRWGTPADMSGIAAFLAAPASDFITGTAIPVDGGYSAQG